jgi:HAD superfamily hydrolase (TIGR01490 family)
MPADVLALFDLDHTLMPLDSDEQWVAFLVEQGALDAVRYDAANRDLIARYNRGEAGSIEFTEFYLSTLTSFDQAELLRWREKYLTRKIRPRIRQSARALIERHSAAGDRLLVTTAVFRFLADAIAAEFGIHDVIATEGEQIDGRFTGRVAGMPNIREGKYERLIAWLASRGERITDFRECWFYGDSLNDLPLFTQVTHPVVVNADPVLAAHARHMGWPELRVA